MSFADIMDAGVIPPIDFPVKVSATAPPSPAIGTAWLDTSAGNVLKVWAAPGTWRIVAASSQLPAAPGADMFLKSGLTSPYNPVWSDMVEGGGY